MMPADHCHVTNGPSEFENAVVDTPPTAPTSEAFEGDESNGHHSLPTPLEIEALRVSPPSGRKRRNYMQFVASVAGNVLEWYDFAVFGYFSDVIGEVFFPPQEGNRAMVESFIVFGSAFIMRPLGGLMLGYIGDTYGRKTALELSIFLMAIPTFSMGCLPSFERVGWLSPILLVIIRLLQGLSVGGQLMSSLVYTVEGRPRERWGLYGSYVMAAANLGTLLGGLVGFAIRESLSREQLKAWGWRIPFLSGILISFSGLYLRLCVEENGPPRTHHSSSTVTEGGVEPDKPLNPIREAFSAKNRRSLLSASMVPTLWSGGFYFSFVWMAIFMETLLEHPIPKAFAVNSFSLLFSLCIFFPFAGLLSDWYGRVRVMSVGGVLLFVCGPLSVSIIAFGNPFVAFLAQSVLGIALSLYGAPMMSWLVESFPPETRLTAVSIGYNLAQASVGGSTPAIATILVDKCGDRSPGFLLSMLAAIALTGLYIAPKRNVNMDEFEPVCPTEHSDLCCKEQVVAYDAERHRNLSVLSFSIGEDDDF